MNSVLLIGNHRFIASITAQVRGLDALMVNTAANASEAAKLIETAAPAVVITQACQLIDASVSKTFGQDHHNSYFLVIEECHDYPGSSHPQAIAQNSLANQPKPIQPHNLDLDQPKWVDQKQANQRLEALSENYIERKIAALEAGADAYIWLLANPSYRSRSATERSWPPITFRASQRRLIQAYIHVGLNRAQRYRDLTRINDWLSAVALVDALTQLSNRRAFDLELPSQIQAARTKDTPLCLMVLDIDFFKLVNDRHGHLVGDDVLRLLAKRLLANMRFYDMPFRYGGEEFVITLSNTDLIEAQGIADRLRESIACQPFQLTQSIDPAGGEPSETKNNQINITVSIGLTELHREDDGKGLSFLHRADQNLLQAKAIGRNRVVSV